MTDQPKYRDYLSYLIAQRSGAAQAALNAWHAHNAAIDSWMYGTGAKSDIEAAARHAERLDEDATRCWNAVQEEKASILAGNCPHPWEQIVTQGVSGDAPDDYYWAQVCTACGKTLEVE